MFKLDLSRVHWLPIFRPLEHVALLVSLSDRADDEEDDLGELPTMNPLDVRIQRQESSHGVLSWNTRHSLELQNAIDKFGLDEVSSLDFSVTIADPSQPDCPLVACSAGFTALTGYSVAEIVGRNCRFLLNGVPSTLLNDETRIRCRLFCTTSAQKTDYDGEAGVLPDGIMKPWLDLPKGELICVQTNARKSGELFKNMFYLRQVELDDNDYIIGLQAGLPDDDDSDIKALERKCQHAYAQIEDHMTTIERILSSKFWYSASMRRQL